MQTNPPPGFTLVLANEEATHRLAADVANILEPGDLIALAGDLGAGKTTFVRALIAHLAGDKAIEVPSPTFTLVQNYELPRFTIVHADLYRLESPEEWDTLGVEDMARDAIVLVEWADRAPGRLPEERLDIALEYAGAEARSIRMDPRGPRWEGFQIA